MTSVLLHVILEINLTQDLTVMQGRVVLSTISVGPKMSVGFWSYAPQRSDYKPASPGDLLLAPHACAQDERGGERDPPLGSSHLKLCESSGGPSSEHL